jgi:SpoVK/Ycf46/Vps4 family AAA+-type ATPase
MSHRRKNVFYTNPNHPNMINSHTYHVPLVYTQGSHIPTLDYNYYSHYLNSAIVKPVKSVAETIENKKRIVNIVENIDTLDDLIQLGMKVGIEYKLTNDIEYNIDLLMIKNLIPEMETLNNMIGQKSLKKQVANLILYFSLKLNIKNDDLLHTIIDGEPGTGKTEFAQKIAKIYLKMGVLKNDIFKKVKRSDLIAGFLGQTALKTMEVLEEVRGGVLFIDEAYSLGNNKGKDSGDSFSKECIDIINQSLTEMRDDPEDYFILMIAGYKDDLKTSFFSFNDGLERRFSIHFTMESYTADELTQIFKKKVLENKWEIEENAITSDFIEKNKNYFKYHGGDMEVLFAKCKISHSKNLISGKTATKRMLSKNDIEDGLKIFIENSNVREREETNISWKTLYA